MDPWKAHFCKTNKFEYQEDIEPTEQHADGKTPEKCRNEIEPWLSAIFQSEHLTLLIGNGLTTATANLADVAPPNMGRIKFNLFRDKIKQYADSSASQTDRGKANFEDDIRIALELLQGLRIIGSKKALGLEAELNDKLADLIKGILQTEFGFRTSEKQAEALKYLKSFLVSFASRTATRDRLQIFTTNYDRFLEYGCDMAGILVLDRFIGKIQPVFRTTKLELDYHYNPPGIRGEPRYVEGVIRVTKLHGSVDWRFKDKSIIKAAMRFGRDPSKYKSLPNNAQQYVIYPNSSKDIETTYFPYAELFRDFSSAVCRPNSSLVIYGYSFGDSHINRIIEDMLNIPSTHIVIISFDDSSGRIQKFHEKNNSAQFSLLIGKHFGDLKTLVENYLPKAAIDRISIKMQKIKANRGDVKESESHSKSADVPEAQE